MKPAIRRVLSAVILLMALEVSAVSAQEPQMSEEVKAWFVALTKVGHPGFNLLIADDTKIELRDLGITQTKREFIDSLDEWDEATRGAILLTRIVSSDDGVDVLQVCYRFASNEQLNQETYRYADGKITAVVQELIGTKCEGF